MCRTRARRTALASYAYEPIFRGLWLLFRAHRAIVGQKISSVLCPHASLSAPENNEPFSLSRRADFLLGARVRDANESEPEFTSRRHDDSSSRLMLIAALCSITRAASDFRFIATHFRRVEAPMKLLAAVIAKVSTGCCFLHDLRLFHSRSK